MGPRKGDWGEVIGSKTHGCGRDRCIEGRIMFQLEGRCMSVGVNVSIRKGWIVGETMPWRWVAWQPWGRNLAAHAGRPAGRRAEVRCGALGKLEWAEALLVYRGGCDPS